MGQAGAAPDTLPDPNEPAITAASSADDLLAQLAGEEIDRLLAEAEDGTAHQPDAQSTAQPEAAATQQSASESPVNAAAASIDTVEKIGDQLDQLLKEIETPKTAASQAEAPATTTTIAQLGAATSSNEVNALLGERVGAPTEPIDDGSPMPIYVRVLELLNSPFAGLPNALREFLGKVAILTMFNSVAVLLYVLIFRRH